MIEYLVLILFNHQKKKTKNKKTAQKKNLIKCMYFFSNILFSTIYNLICIAQKYKI